MNTNNLISYNKKDKLFNFESFNHQKAFLIANYLTRNSSFVFSYKDLVEVIQRGLKKNKIIVKWGIDPTFPSMHIGHLVSLKKIKELTNFLPNISINIILGTGTALLHDPSRMQNKHMSLEKSIENAEAIKRQISFFFRNTKHSIRFIFNHKFLNGLKWDLFLGITSRIKLSDIQKKFGNDIVLSNCIYPVFQAYDSLKINADIEFGGSDQIMNILCGRDAGRNMNLKSQVGFTTSLITQKKDKMSKSSGKAIFLNLNEEIIVSSLLKLSDDDFFTMMNCFGFNNIEDDEISKLNDLKKRFLLDLLKESIPVSENFEKIFDNNYSGSFNIYFSPKDIFSLIKFIKPEVSNTHIRRLIFTRSISLDGNIINKENCYNLKIKNEKFVLKYGKKTYIISRIL